MEGSQDRKMYGYVVYPGNHPAVVEKALRKRNVWSPIQPDKDILQAQFLWKNLNFSTRTYSDFDELIKFNPGRHILLNHFEQNQTICTKSGLLKTLKFYYSHELALSGRNPHIHEVVPTSFIIKANKDDTEYKAFIQKFNQIDNKNFYKEKKNVWFIKPESDNQGKGIILSNSFKQIEGFLVSKPINSGWVVQKAIQKPLLYFGRKFDIRVWVLVTSHLDIYYYNTSYIRTSSSVYQIENMSTEIHLTNNCQQKGLGQYSKFQEGNTLPFKALQNYLETLPQTKGKAHGLIQEAIARMKELVVDTLMSARKQFSRGSRKKEFQLFGYDFLLDEDFRVWLLEVNNNPYLGTPNAFIKGLLPKMIDQMLELAVDPLFPPQNYCPVEEKRFQLLFKDVSLFRLQPIRMTSNSNEPKSRKNSFSMTRPSMGKMTSKGDFYELVKEIKLPKPSYSTPAETVKFLLDTYCFNDLGPFLTPVSLILSSSSLGQLPNVEANLKKIKLITETRIARILLEPRIYDLCSTIISQQKYPQKIKANLIVGLISACKNSKTKVFLLKNFIPLLSTNMKIYRDNLDPLYLEAAMGLLVIVGAFFDRSVFIPGQSRQNELIRQLFIKSNSLKLLLYLQRKYPHVCEAELGKFLGNLSEQDWQLFYDCSGNKNKRCYSPKVVTSPHEDEAILINSAVLGEEKPKMVSMRQSTQARHYRARRHSGFVPK